jgi:hypothetical protein
MRLSLCAASIIGAAAVTLSSASALACVPWPQAMDTFNSRVAHSRMTYDAAIAGAQDTLARDRAQAVAEREEALRSLPPGQQSDKSGALYNAIILEYNAKVEVGGPIEQKFYATTSAAMTVYNIEVTNAKADYDRNVCR